MLKPILKVVCFILAFSIGLNTQASINRPKFKHTPTTTQIKLTNPPKTMHIFALSKPLRVVIDRKDRHLTVYRFQKWANQFRSLPGVKRVRSSTKRNHPKRLVLDIKPGWRAHIIQHHKLDEIDITFAKLAKPMNRWQKAAQPLHLRPVNPPRNRKISVKAKPIIIIDPGHGGKDPGATGRRGHHEKDIVLKIARYLAADINRSGRFKAVLTRNTDRYIPLRQRLSIARKNHAALFVSIHADAAFHNRHSSGSSVYALSRRGATSEAARWVADKENASELMGGVNLDNKNKLLKSVLINLSQSAAIRDSLSIGALILSKLSKINKPHHDDIEQAAFVVLKSPDIPSLLIETGFISNKKEERKLISKRYQESIAEAIFKGIDLYFKRNPLYS